MEEIKFDLQIDFEHFIFGSKADKITLKDFVKNYLPKLYKYKKKYTFNQLKQGHVQHCHICNDIEKLGSNEGKKIAKHIQEINAHTTGVAILPEDILQISLGNICNTPVRCFGYILENCYYIVYIDIGHHVYES